MRENLTTKVETPEAAPGSPACRPSQRSRTSPPWSACTPRRTSPTRSSGWSSEALRDLRTNLLFTKGNLRSIVVTSPEGSHGKTTVSFGLAVSFARAGARTLLIDADLRKGRVSELLNVQRTPGLSEVLRGHPLETAIRHTSLDNLDFLTGGQLGEDPGELLMSEFPSLLHQLERSYDMVVLDSTPLVPISDARIIARFGKATLIVASAELDDAAAVQDRGRAARAISAPADRARAQQLPRGLEAGLYYGPPESTNGSRQTGKGKSRRRLAAPELP